jgi:uncharacterized protein (DUF58 family)
MSVGHGWGRGQVGPGARFLDPVVLQRIGSLELVARSVVEGFMQGLHPSPFLGQSVDFAEHRPYTVGDDPRRVDWRVYARTGRYYVKEFEAETNTNFTVYMDTSRSMGFGEPVTKLDYGKFLAASLAFLARRQGDRVGCITFDRGVRDVVPCSARHLERVLLAISRAKAERSGDLAPALRDATGRRGRKGIIAIVSDLYVEPEELRLPIRRLREMGNDVMVFHILHPAERELPYEGPFTLEDMETGEVLPLVPKELKEEYRNLVTAHVAKVAKVLAGSGADHILADTSRPLDQALFHYLLARQYRKRSGRWASPS